MKTSLILTLIAIFFVSLCVAAEPSSSAAGQSALTVESLVSSAPSDAKIKSGGKWQPVGSALVTQAMRAKGLGKQAEFTIKVAVLEPHPYNGHAIVIHSKPAPVTINGTSIPYVAFIYFDAENLAGLGTTRVGDTVTISGVLDKADIEMKGDSARIAFDLLRAAVKEPTIKR